MAPSSYSTIDAKLPSKSYPTMGKDSGSVANDYPMAASNGTYLPTKNLSLLNRFAIKC